MSMMANGSLLEALSNAHASCSIQKHHKHVKDETIKSDSAAIENGCMFGANQRSTNGNSCPCFTVPPKMPRSDKPSGRMTLCRSRGEPKKAKSRALST
jgi:hypothetical protein